MKSIPLLSILLWLQSFALAQKSEISTEQYRQDFLYFWSTVNEEYCYFDKKQTNWNKVKELYTPALDTITRRDQFIQLLEKAMYEIYDHHAVFNTNTNLSQRLVPSGTDIWAEYINGKPMVTEVRRGFGVAESGICSGMEVIAINHIPVSMAIEPFLPKTVVPLNNEAKSFALRLALAGNHIQPRILTLQYQGIQQNFYPDQKGLQLEHIRYQSNIESRRIGNIGYIRINDCLYDNALIPVFDSIIQSFANTRSLILDFRETPSGGNTAVAKAILGWFIDSDRYYQKHEYYAEEKSTGIKRSWAEIVSPRKGKYYNKPLVVLGNHWTGSIAEGILVGFDALNRPSTTIIGTDLAHLIGAVYSFEMPNTKIRFTFPAERLYHMNGTPRETFKPAIFINWQKETEKPGTDLMVEKAILYLKNR